MSENLVPTQALHTKKDEDEHVTINQGVSRYSWSICIIALDKYSFEEAWLSPNVGKDIIPGIFML